MPDDRICGLNAVAALFARRTEDVHRLYYDEALKAEVGVFCSVMAQRRRPYRMLPPDELERVAATKHHGGIVAVAAQRAVPALDPARPPRHPLLLVLDDVGNPHNLGAIARSAAYFGVQALLLRDSAGQAFPSDAAYRVAEGGLEHMALYRARDLPATLRALDPFYRTVAATPGADAVPVRALPRDRPVALVLGNEERGSEDEVLAACRRRVRIAGAGPVQSLNVAQAAAILLYNSPPEVPLRIHIQSHSSQKAFPLNQAEWDAAAARAPDISGGHALSFGDTAEELAAGMRDAEILIAQTAALAEGVPPMPKVRLIYLTSAGLERLAPFDWLPPGVALLNNRGTHAVKSGEFGLMALLMLVNRVPALVTAQRAGRWEPRHGSALAGHHVVVVGLGTLGGTTAQQAAAFGMRVTGVRTTAAPHPACERVVAVDDLDHVLGDAEFLVLATPLTAATKGLLGRARIAMLRKGAGLVNVGRGGLVDQDAVLDALDSGHLGGAVLDVFVQEPIPPGHRLWTTPNLIITPHTSADDPNTYNARSLDIFFDNLRAYRDGKALPNRFDIARGY